MQGMVYNVLPQQSHLSVEYVYATYGYLAIVKKQRGKIPEASL
jgi:hypothetical protein